MSFFQMDEASAVLMTLVLILLILYYYYGTSHQYVWEKLGVPGPTPWPFLNHLPDFKNGVNSALTKWRKKYGRTYGTYGLVSPRAPTLITSDLDLIKKIGVTDFADFQDRFFNTQESKSPLMRAMTFSKYENWHRMRQIISPMFTTSRMRCFLQQIDEASKNLTTLILQYQSRDEVIPVEFVIKKFVADVQGRTIFGIESGYMSEEENYLERTMKHSVNRSAYFKIAVLLNHFVPNIRQFLVKLSDKFDFVDPIYNKEFGSLAETMIDRQNIKTANASLNKQKHSNFLDHLVSSTVNGQGLDRQEMVGNSMSLSLGGFETSYYSLSMILYLLAKHQKVQDKVREEICKVTDGANDIQYEHLVRLKYTEQVIKEVLRLMTPATIMTRIASRTKSYKGITIPEGTCIILAIKQVHDDPEYWPNPNEFDPEHFSPDNPLQARQEAFMTFGIGPKECVAKKFALMKKKIFLCHLLPKMKFVLSQRTQPKPGEEIQLAETPVLLLEPTKPLTLDVIPLNC